MKWNYRCHSLLIKVLRYPYRVLNFISGMSWLYAHYRNGTYPYQYPSSPRLYFKNTSLWENIKQEWKDSSND